MTRSRSKPNRLLIAGVLSTTVLLAAGGYALVRSVLSDEAESRNGSERTMSASGGKWAPRPLGPEEEWNPGESLPAVAPKAVRSREYAGYVQNLRSIGFPEAEMRELVTTDVTAFYHRKQAELQQSRTSADSASTARMLEKLEQERAALMNKLLAPARASGTKASSPNRVDATARQSNPATVTPPGEVSAPYPVAFLEPAPGEKTDEKKEAVLGNLRREFVETVGEPAQGLDDPAYYRDWQDAQWLSDQKFKAMYGVQAFLERQVQANLNSGNANYGRQ